MRLRIDGSHGEGGGQILRTALALAAILGQSVEIFNIRGGRKKPGLRPQHLIAVKALSLITAGRVQGATLGSTRLFFEPQQVVPADYALEVGTAGSTSLVIQTVMPALLFSGGPSHVVVSGGTHVPWSPCFHYLKEVFLPVVQRMGGRARVDLPSWGWYPKGGGRVEASIWPAGQLEGLDLTERGELERLYLLSAVSNLPMHIGERQKSEALRQLGRRGYEVSDVVLLSGSSPGMGTAVFVGARFDPGIGGFTSLGKKGKPAEKVAGEACDEFFSFAASEAVIDQHLADQLVLYMALAKGWSSLRTERITRHLLTNIWLIEQFLPVTFKVDERLNTVRVQGTGQGGAGPQAAGL